MSLYEHKMSLYEQKMSLHEHKRSLYEHKMSLFLTPGYVRNKRTNTKAVHSSPIGANWNCFCCKTDENPGGWRSCPLLGKLYPDWKQGDRPPVFQ